MGEHDRMDDTKDTLRWVTFPSPLANHEKWELHTWDTHSYDRRGQTKIGYRLNRVGQEALFVGEDYSGSPMHSDDSDDTLLELLSFLTLRPGDTDEEYFEDYTAEQLEFAKSYECEALQVDIASAEETVADCSMFEDQ